MQTKPVIATREQEAALSRIADCLMSSTNSSGHCATRAAPVEFAWYRGSVARGGNATRPERLHPRARKEIGPLIQEIVENRGVIHLFCKPDDQVVKLLNRKHRRIRQPVR